MIANYTNSTGGKPQTKNDWDVKSTSKRAAILGGFLPFCMILLSISAPARCQNTPEPNDPQGFTREIHYNLDGTLSPLVKFKNPNLALPWFNAGVAKGDPLKSCSVVIELSTGRVEDIFAGSCVTRRRGNFVRICQDTGIGESKVLLTKAPDVTEASLFSFLEQYCPGG